MPQNIITISILSVRSMLVYVASVISEVPQVILKSKKEQHKEVTDNSEDANLNKKKMAMLYNG